MGGHSIKFRSCCGLTQAAGSLRGGDWECSGVVSPAPAEGLDTGLDSF